MVTTAGQAAGRPRAAGAVGLAAAVYFPAFRAASLTTGAVLPVDGGLSKSSPAARLRPDLRARFLDRREPPPHA